MKPHVLVIPLLALTALSACFMSAEPRIQTGTLLARGPVAFCTPDEPPCQTGIPSGDGYVVASTEEGEEDLRLRFELLTDTPAGPVYLGEAELRDDGDSVWTYIVARPTGASVDGAPRYEIAMPGCGDMDPEKQALSGVVRADAYACTVQDLAAFRAFLISDYADEFADPAWWANAD